MSSPIRRKARVGWRAPTYNELVRALRLAHDRHAFGPEHCTRKNCSAAEALARIDATRMAERPPWVYVPVAEEHDINCGSPTPAECKCACVECGGSEGMHCLPCATDAAPWASPPAPAGAPLLDVEYARLWEAEGAAGAPALDVCPDCGLTAERIGAIHITAQRARLTSEER